MSSPTFYPFLRLFTTASAGVFNMNGGTLGPVKLSRPGCWLKYLPRLLFLPIQQFLLVAHHFSTNHLYHFWGGIWRILFLGIPKIDRAVFVTKYQLISQFLLGAVFFCFADRSFFENPSNQISDSLSRLHRNNGQVEIKSNISNCDVSIF